MNKDILAKIALELDAPEILNMCLTNKSFNKAICNSESFWLNKLKKDAPNLTDDWSKLKKVTNSKTYKELYEKVSLVSFELIIRIDGYENRDEYEFHRDEEDDENGDGENEEEESEGELKSIEVSGGLSFRFEDLESIRKKTWQIVDTFLQVSGHFGRYTVTIDDEIQCDYSMHLKYCLENITYNTKLVEVVLDTSEELRENDEYEEIFKEVLEDHNQ